MYVLTHRVKFKLLKGIQKLNQDVSSNLLLRFKDYTFYGLIYPKILIRKLIKKNNIKN